ncbi:hypothetical protein SAMN04488136_116112 [Vibrio xiamenensis]|uniref:PD-(D/E)XK endonuclease-like domain-containing protein n=1 Tax=Vibrio xiamenensis TaxID=861298 RepID=A0A1G8CKS2_9VIBR|nr:hypothetical protein SAMN04488136_116112 [Vibrio xiamenensis]
MIILKAITATLLVGFIFRSLYNFIRSRSYPSTPYRFRGHLKFLDEGKTRGFKFINYKYGVGATPDAIYEVTPSVDRIVEIKSRRSGVQPSDIVQAKAGVLAMSGTKGFNRVKAITIKTKFDEVTVPVGTPAKIYRELKPLIRIAQAIKAGKSITAKNKSKSKCSTCRHKEVCRPFN